MTVHKNPYMILAAIMAFLLATPAMAFDVERYYQPGPGSVNSWIIHNDEGIVVIDAQRSLSAGRELAEQIRTLNKPLLAVLITHPHPDHFGGLASVLEAFPGTPVLASQATTEILENDRNGFIAATKRILGDDAPDTQPLPTSNFRDGERLDIGGIELVIYEMGRGEADSATVFFAPDDNALFIGDVADNQRTGFLMEGHTVEWLIQIETLQRTFADLNPQLYPGHGAAGGMEMLASQTEWIESVRTLVKDRMDGGVDDAEVSEIVEIMSERYPNHPPVAAVPNLMSENIKAVASEMAERE